MKTLKFIFIFVLSSITSSFSQWGASITLDAPGNIGWHISALKVNGHPAVCYYDALNGDLKYMRALDSEGNMWGTPLIIDSDGDVGMFTSMAIVNGSPAISYLDNGFKNLKYVIATDVNGSNWGTPLGLDGTDDVGLYTSLKVVNGNPAISYRDVTNGDLKYMRAIDVNGNGWATSVIVDNGANTGWYSSLEIVNGYPAIVCWNHLHDDLNYIRANDANGTTWGSPMILDATGNVGAYSFLLIVNGNPAIGYLDTTNDQLKFIRSTDNNGNNWSAPISLSETGNIGGNVISIAIVNGNPAMTYYNNSNMTLEYIQANDSNGASWASPITVESGGIYTSLIIANGNPAICYYTGGANRDLNYIRSSVVNPLPVEITFFDGKWHGDEIQLIWKTASEVNNSKFVIERNDNERNWKELGFVNGQGTTSLPQQYDYIDRHPLGGFNYYRLKQIDFDKSESFSNVISIEQEISDEIKLYPNPVRDILYLHVNKPQSFKPYRIRIFNIMGNVVLERNILSSESEIYMGDLTAGFYQIELSSNKKTLVKRITKL